jgi:hypothetical protein
VRRRGRPKAAIFSWVGRRMERTKKR